LECWSQIYPLGFFGCALENDHTGAVAADKLTRLSQWYDYLAQLGIGVVLFNPLFESDSHGYDTADFFAVDRRLGDLDTFRR
jgi:glycosidase